jgi:hypothetical protein
MDITQELHKKQYEETDFIRHTANIDKGLWKEEEYLIDKYLVNKNGLILEVGAGGG